MSVTPMNFSKCRECRLDFVNTQLHQQAPITPTCGANCLLNVIASKKRDGLPIHGFRLVEEFESSSDYVGYSLGGSLYQWCSHCHPDNWSPVGIFAFSVTKRRHTMAIKYESTALLSETLQSLDQLDMLQTTGIFNVLQLLRHHAKLERHLRTLRAHNEMNEVYDTPVIKDLELLVGLLSDDEPFANYGIEKLYAEGFITAERRSSMQLSNFDRDIDTIDQGFLAVNKAKNTQGSQDFITPDLESYPISSTERLADTAYQYAPCYEVSCHNEFGGDIPVTSPTITPNHRMPPISETSESSDCSHRQIQSQLFGMRPCNALQDLAEWEYKALAWEDSEDSYEKILGTVLRDHLKIRDEIRAQCILQTYLGETCRSVETALFIAAANGQQDHVQYILSKAQQYSDLTKQPLKNFWHYDIGRSTVDGLADEWSNMTVLMAAARRGNEKIIGALLRYGVDVNVCTSRGSALSIAGEAGSTAIIKMLLYAGADLKTALLTHGASFTWHRPDNATELQNKAIERLSRAAINSHCYTSTTDTTHYKDGSPRCEPPEHNFRFLVIDSLEDSFSPPELKHQKVLYEDFSCTTKYERLHRAFEIEFAQVENYQRLHLKQSTQSSGSCPGIQSQHASLWSLELDRTVGQAWDSGIGVLRRLVRGKAPTTINEAIMYLTIAKAIATVKNLYCDDGVDYMAQFKEEISRWRLIFKNDPHKSGMFSRATWYLWDVNLHDRHVRKSESSVNPHPSTLFQMQEMARTLVSEAAPFLSGRERVTCSGKIGGLLYSQKKWRMRTETTTEDDFSEVNQRKEGQVFGRHDSRGLMQYVGHQVLNEPVEESSSFAFEEPSLPPEAQKQRDYILVPFLMAGAIFVMFISFFLEMKGAQFDRAGDAKSSRGSTATSSIHVPLLSSCLVHVCLLLGKLASDELRSNAELAICHGFIRNFLGLITWIENALEMKNFGHLAKERTLSRLSEIRSLWKQVTLYKKLIEYTKYTWVSIAGPSPDMYLLQPGYSNTPDLYSMSSSSSADTPMSYSTGASSTCVVTPNTSLSSSVDIPLRKTFCVEHQRDFINLSRYNKHRKDVHEKIRYSCRKQDCGKSYSRKVIKEKHEREKGH